MPRLRSSLQLSAALGILLLAATPLPGDVSTGDRELLRRADVSRHAPEEFRAEVRVGKVGQEKTVPLEIWRSEDAVLVRFLEEDQRGKFLVQKGSDLYFLSPGARNAVRLDPKFRLGGQASMDEILGLAYSEDYEVTAVERLGEGEARQVRYELEASKRGLPYPRVHYVVRESTGEPIRVEHVLASGKVAKTIEFAEWAETDRLQPKRLVVKDPLRGGAPVTVEFLEVEALDVPDAIFDLEGGGEARARLSRKADRS